VAVAAVTNAPRDNAELMIRCCGLDELFGHGARLVIGDECSSAKPHPEPYLEGLRRLGVPASSAVAFEDSPSGMASAVAAGLPTFGLLTSQTPETLLGVGAAAVIADYRDELLWKAFGVVRPHTWQ
jgi:beta-phosphoglucomutase-like phosphatase (HAD superfamily)